MSFWKNFARYGLMAAPYVAAPFTGGSSLMMAGIGAGAGAGSALAGGGDMKDALIAGGMGAIPGATAGLNKGAQAALQAGASGGLSTLQPGGLAQMPGSRSRPLRHLAMRHQRLRCRTSHRCGPAWPATRKPGRRQRR